MTKKVKYLMGQFFIRANGDYAPFKAIDKLNRIQTRYVKLKNRGRSDYAVQKERLKRLHKLGYTYNKNKKAWDKKRKEQKPLKKEIKKEQNILLLISIGDYKHTKLDIIIKRVFSADEFKELISRSKTIEDAHERIRNETINIAIQKLRENKHFGLASMIKNNTDIDYVTGGQYEWTEQPQQDTHFIRFDIKGISRLNEINEERIVPDNYDTKIQRKLGDRGEGIVWD
jgi:hypothetical protein